MSLPICGHWLRVTKPLFHGCVRDEEVKRGLSVVFARHPSGTTPGPSDLGAASNARCPQESSYLRRQVGTKAETMRRGGGGGYPVGSESTPVSAPPQFTEKLEPIPDPLEIPPLKLVWRE